MQQPDWSKEHGKTSDIIYTVDGTLVSAPLRFYAAFYVECQNVCDTPNVSYRAWKYPRNNYNGIVCISSIQVLKAGYIYYLTC